MVDRHHELGPTVIAAKQQRADQRTAAQIEGALHFGRHDFADDAPAVLCRDRAKIDDRQGEGHRGPYHLQRLAVANGESGAQAFVAADDFSERALERRDIDRLGERKPERNVVGGIAGRHLRNEPQAFLRKGQRIVGRRGCGGRFGDGGRPRSRRHRGLCLQILLHDLGQEPDGRSVENAVHRQFGVECVAQPRDNLRRHQRMAAKIEEIVVEPDAGDAQHLGPDAGHRLLHAVDGRREAFGALRLFRFGAR